MVDLTLTGQYERAMSLVRASEHTEALAVCRRILETYPRHIGSYGVLGQVCLQMGEHEVAANLFRRVLSADPENILAYASLGAIYEERGLLHEAVWQLERAFELSPANAELRRALVQLYRATHLREAGRVRMTRGGLARAYLQGWLYPKAIGELRSVLRDEPQRPDLWVALAEALWRDGQHEGASLACQALLRDLPNCLKANLILGQLWLNTDRDGEGRRLLQVAQALDPENRMAQSLFGSRSPLPLRTVRLPFREEDAPPLDLPYLSNEPETEVIEGRAIESPRQRALAPPPFLASGEQGGMPRRPDAGRSDAVMSSGQHLAPAGRAGQGASSGARLGRARELARAGGLDDALELYASLMGEDAATVALVLDDLRLLNRVHPGHPRLVALLAGEGHARALPLRGAH
ncbi:MAG: tetratricopeptide repeat protein [Chloroflexi bacterium]|nr:tetratricopeptide repeat protein [Chloroflexota bacterium]